MRNLSKQLFEIYERRRLKMMARQVSGSDVLDIGCAEYPNPFLSPGSATGFDMKSVAPEHEHLYRKTITGNALSLTEYFQPSSFDTIIAGEIIEHIARPYDFLSDIHRILRPGGKIVLSTPNALAFPVFLFEYFSSRNYYYSKSHLYLFTPRWVIRMLEYSRFTEISYHPVGLWFLGFPLPFFPASLSYQVVFTARKESE